MSKKSVQVNDLKKQDNEQTTETEYDKINGRTINFSNCCNQFVIYHGSTIICTGCRNVIKNINNNEHVVLRYKSNNDTKKVIKPKTYENEIYSEQNKMMRYGTDATYELCDKVCPLCGALSRYCRSSTGMLMFVCSSDSCRHVFQ